MAVILNFGAWRLLRVPQQTLSGIKTDNLYCVKDKIAHLWNYLILVLWISVQDRTAINDK